MRYFLPVYRLAERQVGGSARYQLVLRPEGSVWLLEVVLAGSRPDGVPDDTRPLAHEVRAHLVYDQPVADCGSAERWLELASRQTDEGCVCALSIASLAVRDEVFHALTREDAHPRLLIGRIANVAVRASTAVPQREVLDLLALSPNATWAGARLTDPSGNSVDDQTLPFSGSDGDARGFVILSDDMPMEDGTRRRCLRTHPMWVDNGTIKGWHPDVRLPAGAVFEAEVGFVYGAVYTDGVEFIVFEHHFQDDGRRVWNQVLRHHKRYTGGLEAVQVDLARFGGQQVGIELRVDAGASSGQDWAAWVGPRIVRAEPPPPEPRYVLDTLELSQPNLLPGASDPTCIRTCSRASAGSGRARPR